MSPDHRRHRQALAWGSLLIGTALLLIKMLAYLRTGSAAVLSDALESIVNVVAAGFALYSIRLADRPADHDHPYGHGKIEFLAAGFEGALVIVAGVVVMEEAVRAFLLQHAPQRIGEGLGLVAAAAVTNLIVGLVLVRQGRRLHSMALVADGHHLLTDVWTSAVVLVGLGLVWWTGHWWWDPLVALVAGVNVLRVGRSLVRQAIGGIMDEADPEDLRSVDAALAGFSDPLYCGYAHLRSRHQGALHHVDLTIFVPESASVGAARQVARQVETLIRGALGEAEVICHVEAAPPSA